MTLLEITEPLFVQMSRYNQMARSGRAGTHIDLVRNEIEVIFAEMRRKAAAAGPAADSQFKRVEMPLVYFVDNAIVSSGFPFAAEWSRNRYARKYNEQGAGDERFFAMLSSELADPSPEATERLAVYYQCVGLGFAHPEGKPEETHLDMRRIAARVSPEGTGRLDAQITPDAYYTDGKDYRRPPTASLAAMALGLVALTLVVFIAYFCLWKWSSEGLRDMLGAIRGKSSPVSVAVTDSPRVGAKAEGTTRHP